MSQQQKQTMIFGFASIFAVSCQTSPALLATAWMLGKIQGGGLGSGGSLILFTAS
jgi:hypothetical protein